MGSGIDVLCNQAFGAGNLRLVGVTFARGTLLTAFLFVPVAFLWYDMERVLLSIGEFEDACNNNDNRQTKEVCWVCIRSCSHMAPTKRHETDHGKKKNTPNLPTKSNAKTTESVYLVYKATVATPTFSEEETCGTK